MIDLRAPWAIDLRLRQEISTPNRCPQLLTSRLLYTLKRASVSTYRRGVGPNHSYTNAVLPPSLTDKGIAYPVLVDDALKYDS
jgi:hypothetical protein